MHRHMGAKMVDFGGWDMPVEYSGLIAEHMAVRTGVGLFDVSHMGDIQLRGPGSLDAVQHITMNDASRLQMGQAHYSAMLYPEGTFVDDVIVHKLSYGRALQEYYAVPCGTTCNSRKMPINPRCTLSHYGTLWEPSGEIGMANLKLVPQNPFSWSFDVTQNNASIAQVLHTFSLNEKATLNLPGATCQAYREHFMGGDYILEEHGQPLARARKLSAFSSAFQLTCPGHSYALKKESLFCRTFVLMEDDRQVGIIKPEGVFTRKADVSLPDEMPRPVQIFVLWLVLVLWKRDSEAGSAMQMSQH